MEKAQTLGANAFGHGCTGKGNDQFRLEYIMRTLMPDAEIIAPMREGRRLPDGSREPWTRSEEIEYANAHGLDIPQTKDKIWSIDENLWGRSIEGGRLEEPDFAPPEEIFQLDAQPRRLPERADGRAASVRERRAGLPRRRAAVAGYALVVKLNAIAGEHGVGRVDIMEDRDARPEGARELRVPGGRGAAHCRHRALEALVCTQSELKFKASVDREWGEIAYKGLWLDPLKEDLEAFISKIQERAPGTVYCAIAKGSAIVVGRQQRVRALQRGSGLLRQQDL